MLMNCTMYGQDQDRVRGSGESLPTAPNQPEPGQPGGTLQTTSNTRVSGALGRWPLSESYLEAGQPKPEYRFGENALGRMGMLNVGNSAIFREQWDADIQAALSHGDVQRKLQVAGVIGRHIDEVFQAAVGVVTDALSEANAGFSALAKVFPEISAEFAAVQGENVPREVVDRVVNYGDAWQVVAEHAAERFDKMGQHWRAIGTHLLSMMGNERQLRAQAQSMTQAELDASLERIRSLEAELAKGDSLFEKVSSEFKQILKGGRDAAREVLKALGKVIPEGLGFGFGMVLPILGVGLAALLFLRR